MRKRTNKSAAVVQQKAAKVQEADTPEQALYRALSYFPTPPWGTRAGVEVLRELDPHAQVIWEPACGEGHMAETLRETFLTVFATDIHAHGFGGVQDFLLDNTPPGPEPVDWVFTNPPFEHAEAFLRQGMAVARRGVALLLRIAFLEGSGRYPALYEGKNPLSLVAPFSERLAMVLGCYDPDASSAVCMAWFFFQKFEIENPPPAIIRPIPPGTEARLHRREDVLRFAKLAPAPLLEGLSDPADSVQA